MQSFVRFHQAVVELQDLEYMRHVVARGVTSQIRGRTVGYPLGMGAKTRIYFRHDPLKNICADFHGSSYEIGFRN